MSDLDTGFAGRSLCRLAPPTGARFEPLVKLWWAVLRVLVKFDGYERIDAKQAGRKFSDLCTNELAERTGGLGARVRRDRRMR